MPPRVTLVMPCYNAARFMRESIESALAQDHPSMELLVVDDGSADDSAAIAESYARSHPERIRTIRAGRRGATAVKNLGAREAFGSRLMFFDSDDLLSPDAVSSLDETLGDREDAVAAIPWRRLERVDGEWRVLPAECAPDPPGGDWIKGWIGGWFIPPCAILWPRPLLERVGMWGERFSRNDDGELMVRALFKGMKIVRGTRGEAFYRRHDPLDHLSFSCQYYDSDAARSRYEILLEYEQGARAAGVFERYRVDLARAHHTMARNLFDVLPEWARRCDEHARALAGAESYHGTLPHRIGCRLLGAERKELLARRIARMGLARSLRRRAIALRRKYGLD